VILPTSTSPKCHGPKFSAINRSRFSGVGYGTLFHCRHCVERYQTKLGHEIKICRPSGQPQTVSVNPIKARFDPDRTIRRSFLFISLFSDWNWESDQQRIKVCAMLHSHYRRFVVDLYGKRSSSSSDFIGWVSSQLVLPNSLLPMNLSSLF